MKIAAGEDLNSANREVLRTTQSQHEDELLKLRKEFEARHQKSEDEKEALRKRLEAETEAKLEAQRKRLEAKIEAKLEAQRKRLEAEIEAKLEAQRKRLEAEIEAKLEAQRKRLEAEIEAKSLLSVLPESHVPIPSLELRGLPSSNSYPKHRKAESEEKEFGIPDIRNLDNHLKLELGSSTSCLRAIIDSQGEELTYCNEFDVQAIIHNALWDAANICNKIIEKKSGAEKRNTRPPKLYVRRESSIFSNIVDHAVVFDAVSGAPVFIVEVKKGWGKKSNPTKNVYGQVYDQLSEMHTNGHPNPFGALTCFDETYITWLDTKAAQDVMSDLGKYEYADERLDKIIQNFVLAHDNKISPPPQIDNKSSSPEVTVFTDMSQTQSPVQEISIVSDTEMHDDTTDLKEGFTPNTKFNVLRSKSLKPKFLVAAYVSAILCSLDGFQTPRGIHKLTLEQHIQVDCLKMMIGNCLWGTLQTTYKGPKKVEDDDKREGAYPESLYLVDHLGTGNTSRVYRALTSDGYDCVVKMYIKRQDDDKKILTAKDFNKITETAIDREYKKYKEIYGDELKGYVWTQVLNGLHCLIHPYFQHVEKTQRPVLLSSMIPKRLKLFDSANNEKFYAFHKSDQRWRHIGWFKDKLYIFDLGDLEEHTLKEEGKQAEYWIERHCERLEARSLVET